MTDRASLPDCELPATGNPRFPLSAFKGSPLVLYHYGRIASERRGPKVPGLAREVVEFVKSIRL